METSATHRKALLDELDQANTDLNIAKACRDKHGQDFDVKVWLCERRIADIEKAIVFSELENY